MTGPSILRVAGADAFPRSLRGGVVTLGNFDGVHRGHRAVLDAALGQARQLRSSAVVLTFEPHPRAFFRPSTPLPRITPAPLKARLLGLMEFDAVIEQPFTVDFAQQTADAFVERVLAGSLGARHVVTGFDFRFGKGRTGDGAMLREAGARLGFEVSCVEPFHDEAGAVVSSSAIRVFLAKGEVTRAAGLLGYRFTIEGQVLHGQKLGRTLGYPTANMAVADDAILRQGIYAVRLRRGDGRIFDGVASFGRRPTVASDGKPLLETYVFDFDGDLYGQTCEVSFFGFLRAEERFDGLDALKAQMQRDEAEARALLAGVKPLSELDLKVCF